MLHRWRCHECPFIVWAPNPHAVTDELHNHLLVHYGSSVEETVFRTEWECPMCDEAGADGDHSTAIADFGSHLIDHERMRIVSGAKLTGDARDVQTILLLAQQNTNTLNFTRVHLAQSRDELVFVTSDPHSRLQLVEQHLDDRLERVVLISPADTENSRKRPIGSTNLSFDVVHHTPPPGLDHLGKTISDVVMASTEADSSPLVSFDLVTDLITQLEGDDAFRFIHVLLGLFDRADAFALFNLDPTRIPNPTIKMYAPVFDMTIAGLDDRFVSVLSDPSATVDAAVSDGRK